VHEKYLRVLDAAADMLDGSATALEQKASAFEAAERATEAETLKRTAQCRREESSRTRAEIAKKVPDLQGWRGLIVLMVTVCPVSGSRIVMAIAPPA